MERGRDRIGFINFFLEPAFPIHFPYHYPYLYPVYMPVF
jgi:hypothetical protein